MTASKRPCLSAQDFIDAYYKECRPREHKTKPVEQTEAQKRRQHGKPKRTAIEVSDEEFTDMYINQELTIDELMARMHCGQGRIKKMAERLGLHREPAAKARRERHQKMVDKFNAIDENRFRYLYLERDLRLMDVAMLMGINTETAQRFRQMRNINKPKKPKKPRVRKRGVSKIE